MNEAPTDIQNLFFLNILFGMFNWIKPFYRRIEKRVVNIQHKKERIKFLKRCLEEKVIPPSMSWIKRCDRNSPFPKEAKSLILDEIDNLREEVEEMYCYLRREKKYISSQLKDEKMNYRLNSFLKSMSTKKANEKKKHFDSKLTRLIEGSPWSTFSQGDSVVNHSSYDLSVDQKRILGYGLSFSLPHEKSHFIDVLEELERFKFYDDTFNHGFILMNIENIFYDLKNEMKDFLPKRFLTALKNLQKEKSIRVSKADKGGKIVIVNKSDCIEKMEKMLDDTSVYKKVAKNPLEKMQTEFNRELNKICEKFDDTKDVLKKFNSRLPSLPYMYGLPKIHKENIPYRPIISNVNAPSYKLAKWLSKQLTKTLGKFSDAHVKHNIEILSTLKNIIPGNNKFISFDVKSLFTNVPLDVTMDFLRRKLPTLSNEFDVPVECLLELIELCLKNPCFQFGEDFYEQIFGIGMGNPLSCVLANLFLEHVESELLPAYMGVKPLLWKRYVDDVLCLVSPDFRLDDFLNFINSFYPSLKFTFEWSCDGKIAFLDILIHNCNDCLKFDIFRKQTHSESYLHYFSYTSEKIKLGLAQSLFLRALRICSPEFLDNEISHVKNALNKLAYPKKVLQKALLKARKVHFSSHKNDAPKKDNKILKMPYMKNLEKFKRPLKNLNTDLVFTYGNKLSHNLCSNKPKKALPNYGVYEIPCKDCEKIYVGESGRDLKKRVREHKSGIKNADVNNALFVHVRDFDHPIDFENAKIVYPSSSVRRRHIVESALIEEYNKNGKCLNLNKGFCPNNPLVLKNVLESIKIL